MFWKYKNLAHFKSYYWKYKRTVQVVIIVMLAASSLGMLLPYFISRRLLGIADTSYSMVIRYSAIILSIILFHHIFWFFWEKIASVLTNKIAVDIRRDIITKFTNTKYSELKQKTSGYYLERINDDVLEVSSFLPNVLGISADCLTNFSFLVIIYFLSYQCGIIFTTGIIMMFLIEFVKIKVNLKYTDILKGLNERFNSKMNENFRGIKDIKGLGIKWQIVHDTDTISKGIADVKIKKDKYFALLSRCKTYTQYFIEALLIIYSIGYLAPNQSMSTIILLTIINYGGFMYDLVGYIAKIKDWFVQGDYKASRILQILDNNNIEVFGSCSKLGTCDIKIIDLSYSYDKNDNILEKINLVIKENSASVFIGASGSGKTTLFGLLTRLLQCENGKIFIGDVDINELSENCVRDSMCIINQEPFLLNDTVLNNIKIVKPSATTNEVYKACEKAHIYDEICYLKDGFNTYVSENGSNLSGGQKQRISIARAILKNSNILLFDEPTSSLDKINQEKFFETIKELKTQKTVLIIAHKLSDYAGFDNVYELKNGHLLKLF